MSYQNLKDLYLTSFPTFILHIGNKEEVWRQPLIFSWWIATCSGLFLFVLHLMVRVLYSSMYFVSVLKIVSNFLFFPYSFFLVAYYLCSSWIKVGQTDTLTTANNTTPWLPWVQIVVSISGIKLFSLPKDATYKFQLKYSMIERTKITAALKLLYVILFWLTIKKWEK